MDLLEANGPPLRVRKLIGILISGSLSQEEPLIPVALFYGE